MYCQVSAGRGGRIAETVVELVKRRLAFIRATVAGRWVLNEQFAPVH